MIIEFKKLKDNVRIPEYHYSNDVGADIYMPYDMKIKKGENIIPLGFSAIIPPGYASFLCLRSSWMSKGITCNFTPIDPDYSGEYHLIVYNHEKEIEIKEGERICQMIVIPYVQAVYKESNEINRRGSGGIGSTGKF